MIQGKTCEGDIGHNFRKKKKVPDEDSEMNKRMQMPNAVTLDQ